jgi:hypothetical protein
LDRNTPRNCQQEGKPPGLWRGLSVSIIISECEEIMKGNGHTARGRV